MRTTIDMPDALYRKTKAIAALRGSSMKDLIVHAVEHEIQGTPAASNHGRRRSKSSKITIDPVTKLPTIEWKGQKMDLSNFDFDDLLG
jgi:hypothetical protein